jgi:2-methylcitrate dehydratase PrpD
MSNAPVVGPAMASLICSLRAQPLPREVLEAARMCLADWLAVAIGAGDEEAGRHVRQTVEAWRSAGRSTVLYSSRTAAAPMAALANGTLAHCLDFDDTHVASTTHTSGPVWAATLALGEELGRSEDEMLRAFVAGFETATRVGYGLGQPLTARGLHGTGVFGRIGAAAAGAALFKLDETACMHALAAAATQASGLTASFGTMAKPFHAGKAAMDGVLSAQLASTGFEAAPAVLESGGGLDRALIQDGSTRVNPPSGSHWQILANSFKPYAACHLVHPAVDAVRSLNVHPASIRSGRVFVAPLAMQITGTASGLPATALAAKFDLKYCLGLALCGRTLSAADFMEPWELDRTISDTGLKVIPSADPSVGFASARVELDLVDGRTKSVRIEAAKGHPANPMTWDDMAAKLEGLATARLGSATHELLTLVRRFGDGDSLPAIRDILGRLAKPRPSAAPRISPRAEEHAP